MKDKQCYALLPQTHLSDVLGQGQYVMTYWRCPTRLEALGLATSLQVRLQSVQLHHPHLLKRR